MRKHGIIGAILGASLFLGTAARGFVVADEAGQANGGVRIAGGGTAAPVVVDPADHPLVKRAAGLFADDVHRVTGQRSAVADKPLSGAQVIIAGTLGHSAIIDELVKGGKLKDVDAIKGRWEATCSQIVEQPFPGVERAFVIVGSDRRGTAYGLMRLSEKIGVSPWYWWADVPVTKRPTLFVTSAGPETDSPGVKYRGIFINDEDWGLHQWASRTFEPENKGIGPKTYQKVFELMLRLRLNYIWPAMHECTREFHANPQNFELADRFGIVAGASHCEPMLFNNAKWDESKLGKWDYTINRDRIYSTWEESAKTRGDKEAVWGIGIRGIHDRGMQGPQTETRIKIVSDVFVDQRALLEKHVTQAYGAIAQCFVPYKEVLTLYDAGLPVPDDVTLVWVDDNFGYIRRLGAPQERQRTGGAGVYWHLSYYGGPHSYLWINSTPPALMWEELTKAWENDARTLWVINVGDIKPAEIGIDYFSRLAWNPPAMGADSQPAFLRSFAAEQFGDALASPIAELLGRFYRLGTIRKPELMNREWAVALPEELAAQLRRDYEALLKEEESLAEAIPAESRDAYFQMVGFPARILAATGLIFMADRDMQPKDVTGSEPEFARHREFIDKQVDHYNNAIAGGKWRHMMPGQVTNKTLNAWNSQVRWPWGEKPTTQPSERMARPAEPARAWHDAASADRQTAAGAAKWTPVLGLGHSGRALALKPAGLASSWKPDDPSAPSLEYSFESAAGDVEVAIDFLPSFRLYPGVQLRVAVSVDDQPATLVEVPGSSGKEDENGPNRKTGIQNSFVRAKVALPNLAAGKHVLKIRAVDPGVVIDRVSVPMKSN